MTENRADRNRKAFIPLEARKETAYRLAKYVTWLDAGNRSWLEPDLVAYRKYLSGEETLSDRTIISHLSTIRRRYRELLGDEKGFAEQAAGLLIPGQSLDKAIAAIGIAIDPALTRSPVDQSLKVRFRVLDGGGDAHFLDTVYRRADGGKLIGMRDIALIELMLMTGVRESEVIRLKIDDLDHMIGNKAALRVAQTRGSEIRLVPYLGEDIPAGVRRWVQYARMGQGDWLFRTFYQGRRDVVMRRGHMQLAAVRLVLEKYPFKFGDEEVVITSTDMRATYAWHMYHRQQQSVEAIAQYLGCSVALVKRFVQTCENGSRR